MEDVYTGLVPKGLLFLGGILRGGKRQPGEGKLAVTKTRSVATSIHFPVHIFQCKKSPKSLGKGPKWPKSPLKLTSYKSQVLLLDLIAMHCLGHP